MKLHFPWNNIEQALEEIRTATTAKPLYGQETGKGLWLVGDHGVYLMPNTTDGKHNSQRTQGGEPLVVYAKECDPTQLDFDTWWANKRASFGGDDGIDFIAIATIDELAASAPHAKPHYLVMDITPEHFTLGIAWNVLP